MGTLRSTVVQFFWPNTDVDQLLTGIRKSLGGDVGDWNDDDGELTGIAGFKTEVGLNLASYWKPGLFSPLETIGLSIEKVQLERGSEGLRIFALTPPGGNPLGKGRQGLMNIASMPNARWEPFESMGLGNVRVDFLNPRQ